MFNGPKSQGLLIVVKEVYLTLSERTIGNIDIRFGFSYARPLSLNCIASY